MKTKAAVQITIVAVAVLVVGWQVFAALTSRPNDTEDFPDGTAWVCQNPGCSAEFTVTIEQLADFYRSNPGAPLPCPECGGQQTVRAVVCPLCARYFARPPPETKPLICPHCNKELPAATAWERAGGG